MWLRELQHTDLIYVTNVGCGESARWFADFAS